MTLIILKKLFTFCSLLFTAILFTHCNNKEEKKDYYNPFESLETSTLSKDLDSYNKKNSIDSIEIDGKFSWNSIKLLNGELLKGTFIKQYNDGSYFLRKEDSLFIPEQNVLYYK